MNEAGRRPDITAPAQAPERTDQNERQFQRLVDDLMDISRLSRDHVELRKEHVLLSVVVSSAVEASRPLIEELKHELTVTQPTGPVVVDADLTRLAQVVINLLNNAARYSGRGGRIWLTVEVQDADVIVSVKDAGIGIPADQLTRIFEMSTQVDRSLDKAHGGLGIGLSLVQRLVQLHGGVVEARSDGAGKGAEFIARLPIAVTQSEPRPSTTDRQEMPTSVRRILIVDDNKDGVDGLRMLLEVSGNDIRTAYDGHQALEIAEQFRPDIVLLDIGLPDVDGYEVCRRIRRAPWGGDVVLVALTGWAQEDDRRRSREAGFDHHLVKPVDAGALLGVVSSLARNT